MLKMEVKKQLRLNRILIEVDQVKVQPIKAVQAQKVVQETRVILLKKIANENNFPELIGDSLVTK